MLEQSCPVDGCSSSFTASWEEHRHSKHHFPLPSPRTQTQTLPPHSSEYTLAKHSCSVPTSHPANNRLDTKPLCCSAAVDTTISSMSGHNLCASQLRLDDWGNSKLQFVLSSQYTSQPTTNSTFTNCRMDMWHQHASARTFGSFQCALTQLSRKSSSTGNVRPGLTDPKAQNKSMQFSGSG